MTLSETSVCSLTGACPTTSTMSLRCVIFISDNFVSCDEHWRTRLRTLWALINNRYCLLWASNPKYLTEELQSVLRVTARLILWMPSRSPISASVRYQHRVKSEFQAGSPGLQVGSRSGPGVPFCLLCFSGALARSFTSSICRSVDHVCHQNQDRDNRPSGFSLFMP